MDQAHASPLSGKSWSQLFQFWIIANVLTFAGGYHLGFDDNEIVKEEPTNKPTAKVPPDVLEAYYYALYGDIPVSPLPGVTRPGNATYTHSCDVITRVPEALRSAEHMRPSGLSFTYTKYTEAYNIPVVASSEVSDQAVRRACYVLRFLLADRRDLRQMYYKSFGRVSIIPKDKYLDDIPEYSFLGPEYSAHTRGLGAVPSAPVSTAGEENLLCLEDDDNDDEDIMLRHIAQGIIHLGVRQLDPTFDTRLTELYESAMASLWWQGSYATHSKEAYLGEGIQSYYSANAYAEPPNGMANHINNRNKLRTYDSRLFNMVHSIFPCANFYMKRCNSRGNEAHQNLRMDCPHDSWIERLIRRQFRVREVSTTTASVENNKRALKRANRRQRTRSQRRRNKQKKRDRLAGDQ